MNIFTDNFNAIVQNNIRLTYGLHDMVTKETAGGFQIEVHTLLSNDKTVVAFFDSKDICEKGITGIHPISNESVFIPHNAFAS
tara:strand:+ start:2818 stop:3066 length:249 start_codon:yes stop_codon:yes gene_type:complete